MEIDLTPVLGIVIDLLAAALMTLGGWALAKLGRKFGLEADDQVRIYLGEALAGGIGATLSDYDGPLPQHGVAFGEDQGRYIVVTPDSDAILARAKEAGIPIRIIGKSGGDAITIAGEQPVSLERLRALHEDWLPHYMSSR